MKRTCGKAGESSRQLRKSSQRKYPYCIFCDDVMREMEVKKSVEKDKGKGKVSDCVEETRDQVVEVEGEEVPMEIETPTGEEQNGNAINGGGGENSNGIPENSNGSPHMLSPKELAAVQKIMNDPDLEGWGEWHFEDDMIWRQWKGAGCPIHTKEGHCGK